MATSPRKPKAPTAESESTPQKRKRCDNCGNFFKLADKSKGGSPQRFCKTKCRRDFNNNRAGFGKLRETLPRFIEAEVKRQLTIMAQGLTIADVEKIIDERDLVERRELTPEGIEIVRRAVKRRRERITAEMEARKAATDPKRAVAEFVHKVFLAPGETEQ